MPPVPNGLRPILLARKMPVRVIDRNGGTRLIGAVLFIAIALIVIVLIGAFLYFVIWGMVIPGGVDSRQQDEEPARRP